MTYINMLKTMRERAILAHEEALVKALAPMRRADGSLPNGAYDKACRETRYLLDRANALVEPMRELSQPSVPAGMQLAVLPA